MKAVMAFAGKTGGQVSGLMKAGSGLSGKTLGGMSRGLSVLGSFMEFGQTRQQAAAMDQEARDEAMAARQEYIQATEQVTAIDAEFNRLVGDQMVAAASMGIDVASGSVVAARNAARDEADRERRTLRNNADMNARLRRLRALQLRQQAKNTRLGGALKLGMNVASAFMGG